MKPRQAASTGFKPLNMIEVANEHTSQLNGLSYPVIYINLVNVWLNLWPKLFAVIIFGFNLVKTASLDCSPWNCCHQVKQYKIVSLGATKQGDPA